MGPTIDHKSATGTGTTGPAGKVVLLPPDGVLITVKGQLAVSPMPKGVDVMLSCAAIRELVAKKVISMDAVLLGSLRGGGDHTPTVHTH